MVRKADWVEADIKSTTREESLLTHNNYLFGVVSRKRRFSMSEQGIKYDSGKQKWHSLPLEILQPLAELFEAGREKYGKFNCLQPFENPDERFYDATMRHLEACQLDPLAKDEETDCYHAAAVAFNILMRLYHCNIPAHPTHCPCCGMAGYIQLLNPYTPDHVCVQCVECGRVADGRNLDHAIKLLRGTEP